MISLFRPLVAACAFAIGVCGYGAWAWAQSGPPGDAANGKRVYLADGCFTCHGRLGEGGNYYGLTPILAKTKLPFEGFEQQLRNPVRVMPPFTKAVLSDKEAADIYAFLQTLPGTRPVKDFPLLNQ
jgi:mono/diheme cytochrome c family protein